MMAQPISGVELTPPWELWSAEGLSDLLCGNQDACKFIVDIAAVSHIYDDLIDADKAVPSEAVHRMVWLLAVEIPANQFFNANQHAFRPVMATAILNWRAANDIEAGGNLEELRIAHAIRYSLADVLLLCLNLLGGPEYAARNARRARLMGQNDTWAHYQSEHLPKEQSDAYQNKI